MEIDAQHVPNLMHGNYRRPSNYNEMSHVRNREIEGIRPDPRLEQKQQKDYCLIYFII